MDANQPSRRALVLLALVFVFGAALGSVGTYVAGQHGWGRHAEDRSRQGQRARLVDRLTNQLGLTADQQQRLDGILAGMQSEYSAIHRETAPKYDQVRKNGRERIRAILTPEQLPKFEEFLRRLDEERKKRNRR